LRQFPWFGEGENCVHPSWSRGCWFCFDWSTL